MLIRISLRRALAGGACLLAIGGAAACGSAAASPAAQITARGTITVHADTTDNTLPAAAYPDITAGAQVAVVNPAGKVIATSALGPDQGNGVITSVYPFTVRVPSGYTRYGIQAGAASRGTVWFTQAAMRAGPELTLGSK